MPLAFWFIAPSLHSVAKLAGPWGAVAWAAVVIFLLLRAGPAALEAIRKTTGPRPALVVSACGLLLLAGAFAVIFPTADAGLVGGGSDRDEALDLAAGRLVAGEYPYSERTYLGNPVSPMPGAVLLATPLALFATSAVQNLVWLPVGVLALGALIEPPLAAVSWAAALLLLAPVTLHEVLTGGDLLANGLYVGIFCLFLLRSAADSPSLVIPVVWALLLGVALSSRAYLLLLLPPLARALALRRGAQGLLLTAITAASFTAVTLPFVIGRVSEFTPLHTLGKLTLRAELFPGQGLAIVVASILASLALALRLRSSTPQSALRASAWAIAMPVLLAAVASTAATRHPDLGTLGFLLPATVLASMAAWLEWFGTPAETHVRAGLSGCLRTK